jgi:NADH:ubiquinone oxidoreductase subunit 6 (subunit J)
VHELRPDLEAATGVIASVIFAVCALVALAGGLAVLVARRPETALRGLLVSLLASACAYVQMMAASVAAVQGVALAGAAIAALRLAAVGHAVEAEGETKSGWRSRGFVVVGAAGLALLALVLVGTWARQYVWTGRELPPGSAFGSAAALGQAWGELYAPTLLAALLALLVAAIVATAGREHRL